MYILYIITLICTIGNRPHIIQLTTGITLLPSFAAISDAAFSFALFVKTADVSEAPKPVSPSVALFNLNVPENVVSIL